MDAQEVISTILEALVFDYDNGVKSLKNVFNTSRKYSKFNPIKWMQVTHREDILNEISFALKLCHDDTLENIAEMHIADHPDRRSAAGHLLLAIVKLICKDYDVKNSNWMLKLKSRSAITVLAIQASIVNDGMIALHDDEILEYICEMIYDFFYAFSQNIPDLSDDSSRFDYFYYADAVFRTLLNKAYYRKNVLDPLRKHYRRILSSKEYEDNKERLFTEAGQYVFNAFNTMDIEYSKALSTVSDQLFYYCFDKENLPFDLDIDDPFLHYITEEILDFFYESRTASEYIKKVKKDFPKHYLSGSINQIFNQLLEKNYLLLFAAMEPKSFDDVIKNNKLLKRFYGISSSRIYAFLCQPRTVEELINKFDFNLKSEGHSVYKNTIGTINELWKHKAIQIVVNNNLCNNHNTKVYSKAFCYQAINGLLDFFSEPRSYENYSTYFAETFNDCYADEQKIWYILTMVSTHDLVFYTPKDTEAFMKKFNWVCMLSNNKSSPSASEKSLQIWSYLRKPRTLYGFTEEISKILTQEIESSLLIGAIFELWKKGILQLKINNRKKNHDIDKIYWLVILALDTEDCQLCQECQLEK